MNPNDLLAQQQAILNQALNQQHQMAWLMIVMYFAGLAVTAWVLYMFYARLRDIADELRKLRVSYGSAHSPESSHKLRHHDPAPAGDQSCYMPKK